MARQISATATVTQNAWFASVFWNSVRSDRPVTSSMATLLWDMGSSYAAWMAPVIEPGHFLGRAVGDRLLGDLAAAAQDRDAVAHGEHVGHAMADQDHGDGLVAQASDQVQHLGHLAHADRGGRLVHQHDLGLGQPRAGDGHGLALAPDICLTRSRGRVSDLSSANSKAARSYMLR